VGPGPLRSAQLTSTSAKRGHRLLMAAGHAFGLGRADLVDQLVSAAARTDLSELDWARMQWLREIFNDGVPGDATRVFDLCAIARTSIRAGDRDLALNLLLGDWDRAAAAAAERERLARETGQPIWRTGTLVCDALNNAFPGQAEQALR
jgi:hypothetical protein